MLNDGVFMYFYPLLDVTDIPLASCLPTDLKVFPKYVDNVNTFD